MGAKSPAGGSGQTASAGGFFLLAYALLNAALYASLLPLWEGFDEPFHYSNVQEISVRHTLPRIGRAALSREVAESLRLAPASEVVKQNLPFVTTFGDYFRLPPEARHELRSRLEQLPRAPEPSAESSYEAHQAPLAYALLAPFDAMLGGAGLLRRVWLLRLLCGMVSAGITALGLLSLARRIGLPPTFGWALAFIVLSSQMFYATTAHIANDWLAVPLTILLFDRLLAFHERASWRNLVLLAAVLAAGLLTKAYFLAAVALVLIVFARASLARLAQGAALVMVAAGPWYLRNLILYHNLTAMQESAGGFTWPGLATALLRVPWLRSIRQDAYMALWTGNNSFARFSTLTLSMLLAGMLLAGVLYAVDGVRQRRVPPTEAVLLYGCGFFAAALVYATAQSYWFTHGASLSPSPWYIEPLVPIVLALLLAGLSRWRHAGRWVAVWLTAWSAYIISATWWAKLIPLYGGFPGDRTSLLALGRWYRDGLPAILDVLSTTALAPPALILALAVVATVAAAAGAVILSRCILSP